MNVASTVSSQDSPNSVLNAVHGAHHVSWARFLAGRQRSAQPTHKGIEMTRLRPIVLIALMLVFAVVLCPLAGARLDIDSLTSLAPIKASEWPNLEHTPLCVFRHAGVDTQG